jgi:outer membrane biosynthesis protein TonB
VQERVRQRFADELTANHTEQEELTGQIAALQQRLDQLKADEAWLTQAASSLPATLAEGGSGEEASGGAAKTLSTAAAEPAETDAEAPQTVPAQRQKQTVKKAARAKKPAATKSAVKKPAAAKKTTAKKAAAEQAASPKAAAATASADKATTAKAASPEARREGSGGQGRGRRAAAVELLLD